jgi:flagellar motor switch protein FliM
MSDIVEQAHEPPLYDLLSETGAAHWTASIEPALQRINDRFVRNLRAALLQHLRRGVTVTSNGVKLVEHRELMETIGSPSHLTIVTMRPLHGALMLMFDAPLVVSLVESRFGGNGRFPINTANRDFTPFELKSMRRVVDTALEQYALAWETLGRFDIGPMRNETNPQFAGFAQADEQVLASTFDVSVDQSSGKMGIYIPYAAVEPLKDQLLAGHVAEVDDDDPRWSETLKNNVQQASITLNVELGKIDISVGDLVALQPGNVFEMDRPNSLVVEAGGVPLFRGRWGQHGRKIGVMVEERLAPLDDWQPRTVRRQIREGG